MIVMKFGGSSLRSAEAIERAVSIVNSRLVRCPIVVVSAMGKTTDHLLTLARTAARGCHQHTMDKFIWLRDYHHRIARDIVAADDRCETESLIEDHFCELKVALNRLLDGAELTPQRYDQISSFGERLSSHIFAVALRKADIASAHLDSRTLIHTDKDYTKARPLLERSYIAVREAVSSLSPEVVGVLGGFIGSTLDGEITTLGRNSSNLTAVLIGVAVDAVEVEFWTDVDGVFLQDPRHTGDHQDPLQELSFDDAICLSRNGAKVLHTGALLLARDNNIPLLIKNAVRPESVGTRIVAANPAISTKYLQLSKLSAMES